MDLKKIMQLKPQLREIADRYGIERISVFGSVARGESSFESDIDFLVELHEGASMLGIGGFCYEVEQLLGIAVDVIPVSVLPQVGDQDFVQRVQYEAVPL